MNKICIVFVLLSIYFFSPVMAESIESRQTGGDGRTYVGLMSFVTLLAMTGAMTCDIIVNMTSLKKDSFQNRCIYNVTGHTSVSFCAFTLIIFIDWIYRTNERSVQLNCVRFRWCSFISSDSVAVAHIIHFRKL
jgi:hypothetical protein